MRAVICWMSWIFLNMKVYNGPKYADVVWIKTKKNLQTKNNRNDKSAFILLNLLRKVELNSSKNPLNWNYLCTRRKKTLQFSQVFYCRELYSGVKLFYKHSYKERAESNGCFVNSKHLSSSICNVDVAVRSHSLLNCFLNRFLCANK